MTTKKKKRGNPRIKDLGIATRFKPGVSGNPTGRAKDCVLTDLLRAIGNEVEPKTGKTFFQIAVEAVLSKAFRGDVQAFREIADRVEGTPRQRLEVVANAHVAIDKYKAIEDIDKRIAEILQTARLRLAADRGEGVTAPHQSSTV